MKLTTLALVLSLLFIAPESYHVRAQSNEKVLAPLLCAAVVVGVGIIVVIGLKKLCEKIPTPDAPPPIPPVHPSTVPTSTTNLPPWFKRISPPLNDYAVFVEDISTYQIPDNYGGAKSLSYFNTLVAFKIQSSTNLQEWRDELTITQWVSSRGAFSAVYQDGSNIMNTYSLGRTNYVPIDIAGNESNKFFRVVSP